MSEYLSDKPRFLIVKDKEGNIRNEQEFKHNEQGDPTYYKKTENGKVVTELIYEYNYDESGRRIYVRINDILKDTSTIMEYSY